MLWRLGKSRDAQRELVEGLARSPAGRSGFLGHLFLGRILEAEGDIDAAEGHYDRAIEIDPSSEPAAFARAHVKLLRGDAEEGRRGIESILGRSRRGGARDGYTNYLMAHTADGATLLDALRRGVSK